MLTLVLVVLVIVLTSALCSLLEAVLYSVPKNHVERLIQRGKPSGHALRELRTHVDRPIAAILFLNTVANSGGAAIAGALASQVMEPRWLAWFSAAFTAMILLFSEMIPKTAGVVYARPLANLVARPLVVLVAVFSPVIWFFRVITRLITGRRQAEQMSDEELLLMVRLGMRTGHVNKLEARVIRNILQLEERLARDVMTPRTVLYSLPVDATCANVLEDERSRNYSRIPIFDGNPEDLVGVVHIRSVMAEIWEDKEHTRLSDLMAPIHFVLETMTLDELLNVFLERRQHLVAVLEESGGLSGVITLEDVLEEIIGEEIVDEFDDVRDLRKLAHMRRNVLLGEGSDQDDSESTKKN